MLYNLSLIISLHIIYNLTMIFKACGQDKQALTPKYNPNRIITTADVPIIIL